MPAYYSRKLRWGFRLFLWCAGHGAQRRNWRCQAVSESDPRSDLGCKSPGEVGGCQLLAEQQLRLRSRGEEAEGKALARGTRSAYEAVDRWARRPRDPKPYSHPDRSGVDATGMWSEGHAPYPGRSISLPRASVVERRRARVMEVSRGHSSRGVCGEGPNEVKEARGVLRSVLGRSPCGGPDCRK